jgi:hypothetical protein
MSFDENISETKYLIMEMMMVLYRYGITEIHLGGLLRVISEKFAKYVESMAELEMANSTNKTLH